MNQYVDFIIDPSRSNIKGKRLFQEAFDSDQIQAHNSSNIDHHGTPSTVFSHLYYTPDR